VVGQSTIAGNVATHAFRWSGGTMSDLGTLAGGTNSYAYGVSADGNVVVGRSLSSSVPSGEAFRWSQSTGMQSLQSLLVASGVNMTGWTLSSAQSVSADGTVIVGYGRQAGRQEAWLARCSPLCNGLITVSTVKQSFAGQSAMGQTGNAAIGGMLGTMNEYATQAKQSQGARNTPFSVFGYGSYDSDPVGSGTLGMTVDLAREAVGAGVDDGPGRHIRAGRVIVTIAQASSATARANTIAPSQPAGSVAGTNGKDTSHSSASPTSTATAHAIGGRTMTFAVSVASAMARCAHGAVVDLDALGTSKAGC
jgi:probable HAF family extracellular repeat protein